MQNICTKIVIKIIYFLMFSKINTSLKDLTVNQINLYIAINLVSRDLHIGAYLGATLLNKKKMNVLNACEVSFAARKLP